MINKTRKVIKFGYGDVTQVLHGGFLVFSQLSETLAVGDSVSEDIKRVKEVKFKVDSSLFTFLKNLRTVTRDNPFAELGGYVFDFSNLNERSLERVSMVVQQAIRSMRVTLAC
jgi:hypothetical protein